MKRVEGAVLRRLCAREQLEVHKAYPALLAGLLGKGLAPRDAIALAHNTAFLFHALCCEPPLERPRQLWDRFSLGEIAGLCERYAKMEVEDLFEEVEL